MRKPKEYTLEDFDAWWNSEHRKARPSEKVEKSSEYTLEDFDAWWYSKYPEKKPAAIEPKEYTEEDFEASRKTSFQYPEKKPPKNLDPKSRTYIDVNGYRRYSDSHRLVHVHVAEVFVIKRKLRQYEVVHRINGDKLDNRPGNLKVMSWQEHQKIHGRDD